MKTRHMRLLSVLLLTCMMSSMLCSFASASSQSSDYLSAYMAGCTATSGSKIIITVDVDALVNCTKIGADDIYLYESTDGVHFTLVRHYECQDYPNMVGTGWYYYRDAVTYRGTAGKYYYAAVYVYAGNNTGYDRTIYNTAPVRAHA